MPGTGGAASLPSVLQVRFHGRGGQGVVTAAELLSVAAFLDGRHAQAFPSFGSERTGAPVMAFCRIGDAPIRTREPIVAPDALVIQDPTLLHLPDVFAGFGDGLVLLNTSRDVTVPRGRRVAVPANELAREHLGRPMPGAALLGALAAATGVVSLPALAVCRRCGSRRREVTSSREGIDVRCDVDLDARRLPPEVETAVDRIVQEATSNVVRHAAAKCIRIAVREHAGALGVDVADDGGGFDPEARYDGFGLLGIRERVALLDGELDLESSAAGTHLAAILPIGA